MSSFFSLAVNKISVKISGLIINKYLKRQKCTFYNKDLTLITNNCIGGAILNDLKLKFNTPTINLYFIAQDYIKFLERIDFYLCSKITFSYYSKNETVTKNYPIGRIEDIEIHFLHYDSLEDAKEKWITRVKRINRDNLFIMGSDRDNCTIEIMNRFLNLPFKNKIFFSAKKSSSKEVIFFREYSNEIQVGDLIKDDHAWYFHFDTCRWLNTGEIKKNQLITFLFLFHRSLKKRQIAWKDS